MAPSLRSGVTGAKVNTFWASATARLEPLALAALSLGAAAIHFGVISEHFEEDILFGLFFSGVGWFEALWAVAFVLRATRWLAAIGLLASIATVGVWVWAHLIGLPFGPDPGEVEATTLRDLMATLFEILLAVWLGARLMLAARNRHRVPPGLGVIVVGLLIGLIAVGTTIALSVPS